MKNAFNMLGMAALAVVAGCATEPKTEEKAEAKPAEVKKTAAARPPNARQRIDAAMKAMDGKATNVQRIDALRELRKDPFFATNRTEALVVDMEILNKCAMPGWTALKVYDKTAQDTVIPEVCKPVIFDETVAFDTRVKFAERYCRWLAGRKQYAEATDVAKKLVAYKPEKPLNKHHACSAHLLLADCYRWADDYANAFAAAKAGIALNPVGAARKAAQIALDYERPADALAVWAEAKSPADELGFFVGAKRSDLVENRLFDYVCTTNNPAAKRSSLLFQRYFTEKSERAAKARAANAKDLVVREMPWWIRNEFNSVYTKGDYKLFAELYELVGQDKAYAKPDYRRAYAYSLGASGRAAEGVAKARAWAAEDGVDAVARAYYLALADVLEDKDALVGIEAAKLPAKDRAKAYQKCAQWTLNLQKNAACERYSAAYVKLFKPLPERRYAVRYFDKPVTSIDAWRKLRPGLEKTYVDVKMYGDLENLETDVATGRTAVEKTAADSDDAKIEVTALCDAVGTHVFLCVADKNARLVEQGFAGGLGTEMYFAPGDNQPYVCFGSTPTQGVNFDFPTTYTNIDHKRLDLKDAKSRYALTSETQFTDGDYVLHLCFPWDAFYQKLPEAAGTAWKFECMTFGPKGGVSWGGAQGVHESSSWGRLVYDLKPAELRAIKRRLIFRSYKDWAKGDEFVCAPFERWADPVVGDPDFYKTSLAALEKELNGYAACVKADMTDADVDEIYAKALPRWLGIRHEIDKLRREYLLSR